MVLGTKGEHVSMKTKIRDLLLRHKDTLAREMGPINASIDRLETLDEPDVEKLRRQVHTLKGSSGSLGFDAVFASAEQLEHCLDARLSGDIQAVDHDAVRSAASDLTDLIVTSHIEQSSLYAKFGLTG